MNPRGLSAAAMCVLAFSGAASAGTANIPAMRDTTIYQSTSGSLANGAGSWFFTGNNSGGSRRRGLLRFDVSGIPADASITGVSLSLTYDRGSGASSVAIHRLLADWGEGASNAGDPGGNGAAPAAGDATWLHTFFSGSLWAAQGGDFAPTASASQIVDAFGAYSWSSAAMIADVEAWRLNPSANFGWIVRGDEALNGSAKRFLTRENPFGEQRPTLVVTYIPASGALAPASTMGLYLISRRRRGPRAA